MMTYLLWWKMNNRDLGFALIMDLIRLAKAGKPYKAELKKLKEIIKLEPDVKLILTRLKNNLEK